MSVYSKMSEKFYQQFSKTKLKIREKVASSGRNYKERSAVLTVLRLFELDF